MRRFPLLAVAMLFAHAPTTGAGTINDSLASTLAAQLHVAKYTIQPLAIPQVPAGPAAVLVDLGGTPTLLSLTPHSLRADGFRLRVIDGQSQQIVEAPPIHTYRGTAAALNTPDTTLGAVRGSLVDGTLEALVILDGGTTWVIQPLRDLLPGFDSQFHVIYDAADASGDPAWTCGFDLLPTNYAAPGAPGSAGILAATGQQVCEIAVDADFEFYSQNASSVTNTVRDVENVLNAVEGIYEADVGITYEVTTIIVRTSSAANPYTSSDPGTLLNQFDSHWQSTKDDVQRDVAHLFTGRNISAASGGVIGIAWLNGICNSNSYGVSQSKFSGSFSFRVGLTAHELGHNWSSEHCSGSGCFIMCPGIGGCGGNVTKFGTASKSAISSYKNSKSCLPVLEDPRPLPFLETFPTTSFSASQWTHVDGASVSTAGTNEPSAPNAAVLDAAGSGDFLDDEIRTNFILAGGANNLDVSYHTQHKGVESGEQLVVEYWNNNLTWVELNRITSTGTSQTSFVMHQHSLSADAFHNELRLRFRAEVDGTSDDWYVDDIAIVAPPPAAPILTSLSPSSVAAFPGTAVTLIGDNFSSTTQVKIGTTTLGVGSFTVANDQTITFTSPIATMLGPQAVTVLNASGSSNSQNLNYVPTSPPLLVAPFLAFNGSSLPLDWAGDPLDNAFVVVNIDGSTFPLGGTQFLNPLLLLPVPALNAAGVGGIAPLVNGAPQGATVSLQVWMLDPGAATTATLKATNIRVVTIAL